MGVDTSRRSAMAEKVQLNEASGTPACEAMENILASSEGQAAVEDVPKFATGDVTFLYTESEQIV